MGAGGLVQLMAELHCVLLLSPDHECVRVS